MKPKRFTIFRRIGILVFILIAGLCLLFMGITYLSTTTYHEASTQLLNKDVAAHIAKFTSPFEGENVNPKKADSVFYNAMVISPSAEIYFLDTTGKVLAYHAEKEEIKLWKVPLQNIKKLVVAAGEVYVKNPDPRDPSSDKIFSAAEVRSNESLIGYIYVILGSNKSNSAVLYSSYLGNLLVKAFFFVIIFSLIISFIYLNRIQRKFTDMVGVLSRFESGDLDARFKVKDQDELAPITTAFNKMADLLVYNINRLKATEQERKDFIATISHDLRTPLAIARGYTETLLLKRDNGDITGEEQERYAQLIYNKMLQIEDMVKQLFELSKMEAVESSPRKEPFVLSEIVQETVNTFQLRAAERKISLKCSQCVYHVWVNADISMMERVIQNLVDNALKNTPEGGSVQASMAVEGAELIFRIENEGPLLPSHLLQWINLFKQGGSLSDSRPQKLGLGLFIVQTILHLHHTSLKAYTQDNRNVFTFKLPVYTVPS